MFLPSFIRPNGLRPSYSLETSTPTAPSAYHPSFSTRIPVHRASTEVSFRSLKGLPFGMLDTCSNSPYQVQLGNNIAAKAMITFFTNRPPARRFLRNRPRAADGKAYSEPEKCLLSPYLVFPQPDPICGYVGSQ